MNEKMIAVIIPVRDTCFDNVSVGDLVVVGVGSLKRVVEKTAKTLTVQGNGMVDVFPWDFFGETWTVANV